MIWTKASRLTPPCDIPIYVQYKGEDLHAKIFSESDLKELVTSQNLEEWKKANNLEHNYCNEPRILEFWSFIPVIPPDEIIPALSKLSSHIERLKLDIRQLRSEMESIPRITSIQRMIEALQQQIAVINPDPYRQWTISKIEEAIDSSMAPLGSSSFESPPQTFKKGKKKK